MSDDKNNAATEDNAAEVAAEVQPQNAGDGVPMFVRNSGEFFRRIYGHSLSASFFRIKHRGYLLALGFAVLYGLAFSFAEDLFPQLYRAWLNLCMPLAEFIGGLTPRAERITGQLIENGYEERADAALHGIAMAKVFMIPAFICMMKAAFSSASPSPVFVSCTQGTHKKIWFRVFLGILYIAAMGVAAAYFLEFHAAENFNYEEEERFRMRHLHNYHRGDYAIMSEIFLLYCISALFTGCAFFFAAMRPARFTIVEKPPEN